MKSIELKASIKLCNIRRVYCNYMFDLYMYDIDNRYSDELKAIRQQTLHSIGYTSAVIPENYE